MVGRVAIGGLDIHGGNMALQVRTSSPPMCIFDNFHFTFNFKSKVSDDFFKNKNECQLTYTIYPKMSPQIWVTQYFRRFHILNNKNTILICNQKYISIRHKYPLASHVFPNVEDGSPIHCIHFKPTKRDPHKSIKGLQVQPIAQVAFDYILFGKSSLTNNYTWWNEYNFLPKLHKFRPICVSLQIATTLVPSLKYRYGLTLMWSVSLNYKIYPLHKSHSSSVYWNFNNILSRDNYVFVIWSLSLLG